MCYYNGQKVTSSVKNAAVDADPKIRSANIVRFCSICKSITPPRAVRCNSTLFHKHVGLIVSGDGQQGAGYDAERHNHNYVCADVLVKSVLARTRHDNS